MDIEEFYERDPRRRASEERELGSEWLDHRGERFELNWVADTGELYVMHEPPAPGYTDPFGGIYTNVRADAPVDGLVVTVLGVVPTHDELLSVLDGWEQEVGQPGSVHWLADRLRARGVLSPTAEATGPE